MAVELRSENLGLVVSPRISFSHDLSQFDVVPIEPHLFRSNSSIDFNFSIRASYDHEPSSADELFSDGKLIPTQIKTKHVPPIQIHHTETNSSDSKPEGLKSDEKQSTKSFWRFKRSSSLNCRGSGAYGQSLCPLLLLSRSHSTGSTAAANSKRSSSGLSKQNSQRNFFSASTKSQVSSSSSGGNYQKPPLKKGYGNYGKGVRVNPVLNVPSVNLFGLGSIFSQGKDQNKKK